MIFGMKKEKRKRATEKKTLGEESQPQCHPAQTSRRVPGTSKYTPTVNQDVGQRRPVACLFLQPVQRLRGKKLLSLGEADDVEGARYESEKKDRLDHRFPAIFSTPSKFLVIEPSSSRARLGKPGGE